MMGRCSVVLIGLSERGGQLRSYVHKLGKTTNAVVFYFRPDIHSTLQFLDAFLALLVSRHSTKFTVLTFVFL
jgi:hypothetical protein